MAPAKPAIRMLPAWFLLVTVFLTGNAVMMLEVAGTRVVAPFFGVGIYVWSALITVTLLALSIGYSVGGWLADRRQTPETLYLLILFAALLIFTLPAWRSAVLAAVNPLGVMAGALCGSALLFGPPLLLLGAVTPFAIKLYTGQMEQLGTRVGILYALSTLGSFLGTLAMGFYLIPRFSLPGIFFGMGAVLAALPMFYFIRIRRRPGGLVWSLLVFFTGLMVLLPQGPKAQWWNGNLRILERAASFYGDIKVVDYSGNRLLLVDGVTQSETNKNPEKPYPEYVLDMDCLIERYHPGARNVLQIGLGGANVTHCLRKRGLAVEIVEIDPQIIRIAKKYFQADERETPIHLTDGRRYVKQCRKKYDVVILNTFTGEAFPTHMLTREFFLEVRNILAPGGITVLNFVGYVQGPRRQAAAAVESTLKHTHAWCRLYFHQPKQEFSNILFVAGQEAEPSVSSKIAGWEELQTRETDVYGWEQAPVCTDDYCPIEFLNRDTYRQWRERLMEYWGPQFLLE